MKSNSESGHAKNAANFEQAVVTVNALGATYNPTKSNIKVTALNAQLTAVKTAITNVNAALTAYKNATDARDAAILPLNKLLTRVVNALKATDASKQTIETAMSVIRKLRGVRVSPKLTEEQKAVAAEKKGKEIVQISSSQMSFDSRMDNFDKFIKLLAGVTVYNPNESDLKVASLTSFYNDLKAKNLAAVAAEKALNNAREARNSILYKPGTGVLDTAAAIKAYVKSLYGANTIQLKSFTSLRFANYSPK